MNKKIIFIASYPKSGNTWLRCVITALLNNKEGLFKLQDLEKILLFSKYTHFNSFKELKYQKNGNLDFNFVVENWIRAQKKINADSKKIVFFKTHNVRGIVNNKYFTDESVCLGYIYIVRDPRDVVISLANHMGISTDAAINEMLINNKRMTSTHKVNELVSTWKNNLDSWMQFQKVPRLIIKYEDMLHDIDQSIIEIINFLNLIGKFNIDKKKEILKNIKYSTNFKELQEAEKKHAFKEASKFSNFFRKGTSKQWVKGLTNKQKNIIEKKLFKPMNQLGYID